MFERFTDNARQTVVIDQEESRSMQHGHIGTEHLLLGLLAADGSMAYRVLTANGLTTDGVRTGIQRNVTTPGTILTGEDAAALRTVGIDVEAVLKRIEESFGSEALRGPAPQERGLFRRRTKSRFTPRAKKTLELGLREALRLKDKHIGTEHILLGIIREGEGLAAQIITEAGVSLDGLRQQVLGEMGKAA
jgi:ATP-dependent Clp protease ATP-binding subunit ClpA